MKLTPIILAATLAVGAIASPMEEESNVPIWNDLPIEVHEMDGELPPSPNSFYDGLDESSGTPYLLPPSPRPYDGSEKVLSADGAGDL